MTKPAVTLEVKDRIALITIDRPPVNAIDTGTAHELRRVASELDAIDANVAVLRGANGRFSGGFDVNELRGAAPIDVVARNRNAYAAYGAFATVAIPVIAQIDGYVVGGACELALACDLRVMASDAFFAWPEIDLAGFAHMQRLEDFIGPGRARLLVYTGDKCYGPEAEKLGLVDRLAPSGRAHQAAMDLAAALARKPRRTLRACKAALRLRSATDLERAQLAELALAAEIAADRDRSERLSAFGSA